MAYDIFLHRDNFETVNDMIDNGTVLDLMHPQGSHIFVISGK